MLRLLFSILLISWFCATVEAAQTDAGFTVGIRVIGKTKTSPSIKVKNKQYTWNAAHVTLVRARYGDIRKTKVSGALYWFRAQKRGLSYRIAVSRARGKIVKIVVR